MSTESIDRYLSQTDEPRPVRQPVRILYTNHHGVISWRRILPDRVWWGASPWYPRPQWLLDATDVESGQPRTFALADIHRWEVPSP